MCLAVRRKASSKNMMIYCQQISTQNRCKDLYTVVRSVVFDRKHPFDMVTLLSHLFLQKVAQCDVQKSLCVLYMSSSKVNVLVGSSWLRKYLVFSDWKNTVQLY